MKQNIPPLPFREFLEKSTNLLTIFGVLNALFLYSTTLKISIASQFLMPSLLMLSLLVWFELIKFAMDSTDDGFRYQLFYFLSCSVEIGLIAVFVVEFKSLIAVLLVVGFLLGLIFGIAWGFLYVFAPYLSKLSSKQRSKIIYTFLFLSAIAGLGIFQFCLSYVDELLIYQFADIKNKI